MKFYARLLGTLYKTKQQQNKEYLEEPGEYFKFKCIVINILLCVWNFEGKVASLTPSNLDN